MAGIVCYIDDARRPNEDWRFCDHTCQQLLLTHNGSETAEPGLSSSLPTVVHLRATGHRACLFKNMSPSYILLRDPVPSRHGIGDNLHKATFQLRRNRGGNSAFSQHKLLPEHQQASIRTANTSKSRYDRLHCPVSSTWSQPATWQDISAR